MSLDINMDINQATSQINGLLDDIQDKYTLQSMSASIAKAALLDLKENILSLKPQLNCSVNVQWGCEESVYNQDITEEYLA